MKNLMRISFVAVVLALFAYAMMLSKADSNMSALMNATVNEDTQQDTGMEYHDVATIVCIVPTTEVEAAEVEEPVDDLYCAEGYYVSGTVILNEWYFDVNEDLEPYGEVQMNAYQEGQMFNINLEGGYEGCVRAVIDSKGTPEFEDDEIMMVARR